MDVSQTKHERQAEKARLEAEIVVLESKDGERVFVSEEIHRIDALMKGLPEGVKGQLSLRDLLDLEKRALKSNPRRAVQTKLDHLHRAVGDVEAELRTLDMEQRQ